MFLPANPDEAVQPMDVAKLLPKDEEWIADRLGAFDNYIRDQRRSARLMGQLFNAAASALAAYSSREDDLSIHRVTAIIPNLDSYPLRLRFQLSDMNSETGWTKHRHVGVWVPGTTHFLRLQTEAVEQDWAGRCLTITRSRLFFLRYAASAHRTHAPAAIFSRIFATEHEIFPS
ncbi:unnamed protein product [Heligmosomoides polygyrus]|uniref:CIA30 domain-containing protein n=1 Tax=Heligmosomoides polygyrus TaxID=6339 RepID=A0A183FBR5_HELPZ|nr:unnamed protein product [Heligmosomoides polygyrus]